MSTHGVPIYIALVRVDLRFGSERLGAWVREHWAMDPRSRAQFVFVGKQGHTMKMLTSDGTGTVMPSPAIGRVLGVSHLLAQRGVRSPVRYMFDHSRRQSHHVAARAGGRRPLTPVFPRCQPLQGRSRNWHSCCSWNHGNTHGASCLGNGMVTLSTSTVKEKQYQMKHFSKIAVGFLVMLGAGQAFAAPAWSPNSVSITGFGVTEIDHNGSTVVRGFFDANLTTAGGKPACATASSSQANFDFTGDRGRSLFSAVQAAYLAGKKVQLQWSTTCVGNFATVGGIYVKN